MAVRCWQEHLFFLPVSLPALMAAAGVAEANRELVADDSAATGW
jgi:hypothetical protein